MACLRRVFKISAFSTIALACYSATDFNAEGNRWWSYVEYLASDALQGRGLGTEGFAKASNYVAAQFRNDGLKPAGTSDYFQPIRFNVREIEEGRSSVSLMRAGQTTPLVLGEDAIIRLNGEPAADVDAGAVFAGYGLKIPEAGYDDLAGLDLKGKIVVFLSGGPADIPGPLKSHYQAIAERWKVLRAAGAGGIATIPNPKAMDIPWSRSTLARFRPVISLADPAMNEMQGLNFDLTINPAHADKFLAGSGHTFAEILAAADSRERLPRFQLPAAFKAHVAFRQSQTESRNTAGIFEGTDPNLKNEYVVMSAHLDHLGVGKPIQGDPIYNGAMDDASGVASILDIAAMLHDGRVKTRRSVLFVVVTGEESGLLGSRYFATHPTVKAGSIVADINLDMFLPLHSLRYLEVQGVQESSLGRDIRAVAAEHGVDIQTDKEPERNLFIRSDQYSFIKQGIPALAFKFGYITGSPEEKMHKDWLKNRYHAPSDDVHQPVDKAAAGKFDIIIEQLLRRVADAAARPAWNEDSFFRRFRKG